MRIEVIAGSPRKNSLTQRLALYLQKLLKERTEHEAGLIDLREHPLPHVQKVITSVDEAPEQHRELVERMFAADAFVIVTPEFNGSYSPAMQNLFDHFPKQHHKVFALATASPGALGRTKGCHATAAVCDGPVRHRLPLYADHAARRKEI